MEAVQKNGYGMLERIPEALDCSASHDFVLDLSASTSAAFLVRFLLEGQDRVVGGEPVVYVAQASYTWLLKQFEWVHGMVFSTGRNM